MEFFLASSDIFNIWESFLKKSTEKTPYDQMFWKNIWINHFSKDYKFEYIYNEDFFVPLKINDSIASIIGDKDIVDYNNILSINQNLSKFEEILDQIFSLDIKIFQIFSISEKSSTYRLLSNEKLQKKYSIIFQKEDVSPYLKLPETWDEYISYLPKKKRHELRRKIRRLEENTEFDSGDYYTYNHKDEILENFFKLHRISSQDKNKFMTSKMENFFIDLISQMLLSNSIIYSYLNIDGSTVACSLSFLDSNIRYLYNSGFDPSFNNFSSGLLNHAFAIKRSIEKKYDIFDFMRGNERYKYDLGGIDTQLYTVILEKK
tara:strand:- start:2006 stop:2959 length:954 start_codon:yes stop_codon:yes gene_type:complete